MISLLVLVLDCFQLNKFKFQTVGQTKQKCLKSTWTPGNILNCFMFQRLNYSLIKLKIIIIRGLNAKENNPLFYLLSRLFLSISSLCLTSVSTSQSSSYLFFFSFFFYFYCQLRKEEREDEAAKDKQRKQERGQTRVRGLEKYFSHGGDWILTRQASSILHCTVSLHCFSTLFFLLPSPLLQISKSPLFLSFIHHQTSLGFQPSTEGTRLISHRLTLIKIVFKCTFRFTERHR